MPSCESSKNKSTRDGLPVQSGDDGEAVGIQCGFCQAVEQVGSNCPVFVCSRCSRINRVVSAAGAERQVSIADEAGRVHHLVRSSSTTFHPIDSGIEARPGDPVVPQCQVCMDGPGDMVLLPCAHGAICESCAKHIARNLSVGGNHCIKCREEITELVRLSELHRDHAIGVTVEVPKDSIRKGPPKVPPPPGMNKSKPSSANSSGNRQDPSANN